MLALYNNQVFRCLLRLGPDAELNLIAFQITFSDERLDKFIITFVIAVELEWIIGFLVSVSRAQSQDKLVKTTWGKIAIDVCRFSSFSLPRYYNQDDKVL